jgi:hypothetical protein
MAVQLAGGFLVGTEARLPRQKRRSNGKKRFRMAADYARCPGFASGA